jgi:alpha-N-acetylglucosaminidase
LQIRILAGCALGMKPVLPAFAGYVPEAFAKAHPKARIYKMRPWEGFAPTYWLDPSDPLFAQLAKRFLELYNQTYGAGDYYLADAFNEMIPPLPRTDRTPPTPNTAMPSPTPPGGKPRRPRRRPAPAVRDARLAAYGERLYGSITAAAPHATWVMQGWLFGADKAFWTPEAIPPSSAGCRVTGCWCWILAMTAIRHLAEKRRL